MVMAALDRSSGLLRQLAAGAPFGVTDLVPGGDHVIVLATVLHAAAGTGAPLTHHGRRFGSHAPVAA